MMTGMNSELVSKQPDPQMQPPTSTSAPCGDQPPATPLLNHCSTMQILPFVPSRGRWPSLSQLDRSDEGQLQLSAGIAKLLPILRPRQPTRKPQYTKDSESTDQHPKRWTRSCDEGIAGPHLDADDRGKRVSDLVSCPKNWRPGHAAACSLYVIFSSTSKLHELVSHEQQFSDLCTLSSFH